MGAGGPEAPRLPEATGRRAGAGLSEQEAGAAQRLQRLVFGEVAELYDAARPSYPTEMVADVLAALETSAARRHPDLPRHWLESGAGTGKASLLFASHLAAAGAELNCLEPDPAMAAVLRRNLEPFERASVLVSSFEDFAAEARAPRAGYELIYAAQSWHWLDRRHRAELAARLLAPGGVLALIWNMGSQPDRCLQHALHDVYAAVPSRPEWRGAGKAPTGSGRAGPDDSSSAHAYGARPDEYVAELEESGLFSSLRVVERPWTRSYATEDWLRLLRTQSDHRLLPPAELEELLARIAGVVDARGGSLTVSYSAAVVLATTVPDP